MVMAVLSASGCCMFWILKAPREEVIETVSSAQRIQGGSTILVVSSRSKKESENAYSGS
jgi:hypothetical protein